MANAKLLNLYFDYLESYRDSFLSLYSDKNKVKYFYTLGFIYANYMELFTKFCIGKLYRFY